MKQPGFLLCCALILYACSPGSRPEKEQASLKSLPMEAFSLDDLSSFRKPDTNWLITGNAYANRKQSYHMEGAAGKGVLLARPSGEAARNDLLTQAVFSDMDLSLDFMLSAGASAAILFQGKYPVQLQDNWMKDSLTSSDCGGIAGHAPLLNACRAPGLWQHLEVTFKAPRAGTEKGISQACITAVRLNGTLVQENITLDAADTSAGPLLFRTLRGPVAFRHIRYKAYGAPRAQLADMRYRIYKGVYKNHDTLASLQPVKTGTSDSLTYRVGDKRAQLVLEGKLLVPRAGDYLFQLLAGGPARLLIDDREVTNNGGTRDYQRAFYGKAHLQEGEHSFQLSYANYDESLVLRYEGPQIPLTALTTAASEREVLPVEPLEYPVKGTPLLQRGFMHHDTIVNPYTISVGIPGGLNYAYDLATYSPLSAWHGRFIDVSEMWRERGEKQLQQPLGAALEFAGLPLVATDADHWPGPLRPDSSSYTSRGYRILPNGLPLFFYTLGGLKVEDYLHPLAEGKGLTRDITVTFRQPGTTAWCLLAGGGLIEKLPDGSYAVDDKSYYIETDADPQIRRYKGKYQLLLPLSPAKGDTAVKVSYGIIW